MIDLEITRLCAEAMEDKPEVPGASSIWGVTKYFAGTLSGKTFTWVRPEYNPLHDDAQCMALVKKFEINCTCPQFSSEKGKWMAVLYPHTASDISLNRAVCECVAKMQIAKEPKQ